MESPPPPPTIRCTLAFANIAQHHNWICRQQLAALAKILERADPVLFHHLRHIKAADCFFAYRMVIVQLRREIPLQQVKFL